MAAGAHCYKLRRYATAIKRFEAAVKLAESFGARHVDLGRALFHLGTAHSKGKVPALNASLLARAFAILDEQLPADNAEVIACLRSLNEAYFWKQRHADAEPLKKRLLTIHERTLGLLHKETSLVLRDLGYALECQQKYVEADQLYNRWLQAAEQAWGPNDLRVIKVVEDSARNFRSQGEFSKAESLYRRALAARETYHWKEKAEIAKRLFDLAQLSDKQGRVAEAETFLRRSVGVVEDVPVILALAQLLRRIGQAEQAGQFESRAEYLRVPEIMREWEEKRGRFAPAAWKRKALRKRRSFGKER